MSIRLKEETVTETRQVLAAYVCDYCGAEDTEYPKVWTFHAPGWVYLKWGSDPLYAREAHACPVCAERMGLTEWR